MRTRCNAFSPKSMDFTMAKESMFGQFSTTISIILVMPSKVKPSPSLVWFFKVKLVIVAGSCKMRNEPPSASVTAVAPVPLA